MRSAVQRLGHDPKIHRALVARRSGGRSLGSGRFFGSPRAVGTQLGHGIQAQSRALPVFLKWGQQALKTFS